MRRASLPAVWVLALARATSPANAATEEADHPTEHPGATESSAEAVAKPAAQPSARPEGAPSNRGPQDAAAALVRAAAAYEYGDLNQVVEAARFVTEGSLPATQEQQTQAFRLLGIGLYLTNRPLGAEAAFTELLRNDPRARLDPTTTRPELVAFFESLRHQHLARERSTRRMLWNFIPPGGQFQNEDNVKAWTILGVGVVAAATYVTSLALYEKWIQHNGTSTHYDTAQILRPVNAISGAVLIAVYVYGVFDGLIGYSKPIEDSRLPVSLHFFPGGSGLGFTF